MAYYNDIDNVQGVDFNKCPPDIRLWATAHGVIGGIYNAK